MNTGRGAVNQRRGGKPAVKRAEAADSRRSTALRVRRGRRQRRARLSEEEATG